MNRKPKKEDEPDHRAGELGESKHRHRSGFQQSVLGRLAVFTLQIMARIFARIPGLDVEDLILRLITQSVNNLSAKEALRFLFRLDGALYTLQGQKAVEYGGGVHTKHRHTRYHDFFVKRVQPGETVLDIGCGMGAVAYDVAKRTEARVLGIDLDAESITRASERHAHPNVRYIEGDVLEDLPDGPFDVVILSNVLEHLPERPAFLRRVMELAKPSRFLIRVPLFERDWRVPLKQELNVEWRLDPTHKTEYTLESFLRELEAAGLTIACQEVRWGEIWVEAGPDGSQDQCHNGCT